jgi:hypothetical protein
VVPVEERDRVLNKGTLLGGIKDTTPEQHILISTQAGEMYDGKQEMFSLVREMARMGQLHRHSNALSREGFRMLIFDWAMGAPDPVTNTAQIISRRTVDTNEFPVQGTLYSKWSVTQLKSSPRKRLYKNHCKTPNNAITWYTAD